jgi:hypothetical protein
MIMKCSHCGGNLEIIGFNGSAVHTHCANCNIEARPRSQQLRPKIISSKQKLLAKKNVIDIVYRRSMPAR